MKPINAAFPKSVRLNNPREYTQVFESATVRRRNGALRIIAVANRMQTARLGLVVGKRVLPHAVDRNRAKRVLRDTFRKRRCELPNMDIVLQVTGAASNAGYRDALLALLADLRPARQ